MCMLYKLKKSSIVVCFVLYVPNNNYSNYIDFIYYLGKLLQTPNGIQGNLPHISNTLELL